jgi:hypothetical protein
VVRAIKYVGEPPVAEAIIGAYLTGLNAFVPPDILRRSLDTGINFMRVRHRVADLTAGDVSVKQ